MSMELDEIISQVKNPMIKKLLKSLERQPEYVAEQRRRYFADKEFRRSVFEDACRKAGLLEPGRFNFPR